MTEPDIKQVIEETAAFTQDNAQMQNAIKLMGGGINTSSYIAIQLEVMINMMFNDEQKILMEFEYQRRLNDVLKSMMKQAREFKLQQGVPGKPKLVIAKKK